MLCCGDYSLLREKETSCSRCDAELLKPFSIWMTPSICSSDLGLGLGLRVGSKIEGCGFRVLGWRVQGLGMKYSCLGFRV